MIAVDTSILVYAHREEKLLKSSLDEGSARADSVLDASIVALCREHGVDTVLTADRDFNRFPSIRVQPP